MPPEETPETSLRQRIESRDATIGVAGLGYIGLPIASAMIDAGFAVLGYNVDASRVAQLAGGKSDLGHLGVVEALGRKYRGGALDRVGSPVRDLEILAALPPRRLWNSQFGLQNRGSVD